MSDAVVKSAARVLDVLEYFADRRAPASVGEICKELGIPQSSASVLLKSLLSLGYLDYDTRRRTYMPTMRVALLGSWVQNYLVSGENIVGLLETIQRETHETVLLAIQNEATVQYIHIVEASHDVRLHVRVGARRPIVRTATGKMLLSLMPNVDIRKIVRRVNSEEPVAKYRVKEAAFVAEIDEIRSQGYAETHGDMISGASVVARLMPRASGEAPMAIGIGGPLDRIEAEKEKMLDVLSLYLGPADEMIETAAQ